MMAQTWNEDSFTRCYCSSTTYCNHHVSDCEQNNDKAGNLSVQWSVVRGDANQTNLEQRLEGEADQVPLAGGVQAEL